MIRSPLYWCTACNAYTFHPDTWAPACPLCRFGYRMPVGFQRVTKFGRFRLYYCRICYTLYRMPKRGPLPVCRCSGHNVTPLNYARFLLCTEALSAAASRRLRASL